MFIEILDCSFPECYVASILKSFPYEIRNILRFMLRQEIKNILSLAIALKIKDLPALNKIIWMVCPDCSSMGYSFYSPAMATACWASQLLHFRLQMFLTTFASFTFIPVHTTTWFQNITEFFRTLVSTPRHDRIYTKISFLQSYLTILGKSFTRCLDYICPLDTDYQICNSGEIKTYHKFR